MKKIILLTLVMATSSCGLLGIVTTVGSIVAVDNDRRSVGAITDDNILDVTLESWASNDEVLKASHLNFNIYDGVVLITGEVATPDVKAYLNREIYKQSDNIKKIIDETLVISNSSLISRYEDKLISSKILIALNNTQEVVNPVHIKISIENKVVYLMGDVTKREGDKATKIIADITAEDGVRKIVKHFNYIKSIPTREIVRAQAREKRLEEQRLKQKKLQELERQKQQLQQQIRELERQEAVL